MADKPTTLYLPEERPTPPGPFPWTTPEGHVFIAMDPVPEKRGSIYLPGFESGAAGKLRSDTGYVVASDDDEIKVGDWALVAPYVGTFFDHVEGFEWDAEIRLLGSVPDVFKRKRVPLGEDILGKIEHDGALVPYKKNILIKRDKPEEKIGSLVLADNAKRRPDTATVVAVGGQVDVVAPGQRIAYSKRTMMDFDMKQEGFDEDLAFIDESAVLAIC